MLAQKSLAIIQSNYIPWKGYFDLIGRVDEFILFDDMQFTRRDWRNRNKIKTPNGIQWLTIPVLSKGKYFQPIKETQVENTAWAKTHWKTIEFSYGKSPYYEEYAPIFRDAYDKASQETYLSKINYLFIATICELLGITTKLSFSMDYQLMEGKTERLVNLCQQAGATTYVSGPAARDYIEPTLFEKAGISLEYVTYDGYPEYTQLFPPFDHFVSILDLIFNEGSKASQYMKYR